MWGCMWDAGGLGEAENTHKWRVDGMGCARLGDRWRWVHTAGRGCLRPAAPTLMYTQTQGYAQPKPAESQRRCAWGNWLSACFKLEMACFPEERDKTITKGRGICQPRILRAMCLQIQEHKDWSNSWLKSDIHSQMFTRSLFLRQKRLSTGGLRPSLLYWTVAGLWSAHAVLDQCVWGE